MRSLGKGALRDPVGEQFFLLLVEVRRAVERHAAAERRTLVDLEVQDAVAGTAGDDDVAAALGAAGPQAGVVGEVEAADEEAERRLARLGVTLDAAELVVA